MFVGVVFSDCGPYVLVVMTDYGSDFEPHIREPIVKCVLSAYKRKNAKSRRYRLTRDIFGSNIKILAYKPFCGRKK